MSHWDAKKREIVRWKAKQHPRYEGWLIVDCGCSGGVEWGAVPPPTTCRRCGGGGVIHCHKESGVLAQWPGGPLLGAPVRDEKLETWKRQAKERAA